MKQIICLLLILTIVFSAQIPNNDMKFLERAKQFKKLLSNQDVLNNNPSSQFQGTYEIESFEKQEDNHISATIVYQGDQDTFLDDNNKIIKKLHFCLQVQNNNELSVRFHPLDQAYFDLPKQEPFPYEKDTESQSSSSNFQISVSEVGKQLNFIIKNQQGVIIYNTQYQPIVFTELYVAFGSQVYDEAIWGWGQQRGVWQLEEGSYSIWNLDQYGNMTEGQPGQQTYGSHPVYLQKSNVSESLQTVDTQYWMVYLRSSYGMELDYIPNNSVHVQVSGGPIELKFFAYENPRSNIAAYSKYVNGWSLYPFWASGFQISKYGIKDSEELKQIWQTAIDNEISLDVMWSDIDYMQNYEDFTISDVYNVEDLNEIADLNTPEGVHWVPIIDAGVAYRGDSGQTGLSQNVFIESARTNQPLIGCVWPGAAYFVDFNNPLSKQFWVDGLKNITSVYNAPQPSGIWLDMNDPASFTDASGEVENPDDCVVPGNTQKKLSSKQQDMYEKIKNYFNQKLQQIQDKPRNIKKAFEWGYPWSPNGDQPLDYKTISTDAIHYNEEDAQYIHVEDFQITEYEMHNLYGFLESIATNEYLKETVSPLPFIVSRSTFAGQGKYSQVWTGDSQANWDQLITTLGDLFSFQIFQIPIVGGDVCGFLGDTTAELCARWYQFGAFYPFFRSHNDKDARDQYPWSFPDDPYVLTSSRNSINMRYSLLKWLYTITVREQPNGTLINPLFFDYPEDSMAQAEAHQALLGSEVMITPVLEEGDQEKQETTFKIYFPGQEGTTWYGLQDNKPYDSTQVYEITVPFDSTCPFFVKQGSIVVQQPQYLNPGRSLRARDLDNSFGLIINLDDDTASGNILAIDSYDEQNVVDQCVGDDVNCILDITVKQIEKQGSSMLEINILPKNGQTNYQGIIQIDYINILNTQTVLENQGLKFDSQNTNYTINLQ